MKKFFAILLALVMVFSLAACGAKNETPTNTNNQTTTEEPTQPVKDEKIGYYKLTKADSKDPEDNPLDENVDLIKVMEGFGFKAFMVLEEDNKGFIHLFETENELTWDEKSITIIPNEDDEDQAKEAKEFTYENGTLTFEDEDSVLVFTKSDETAPKRGEVKIPNLDDITGTEDPTDESKLENPDAIILENVVLVDNEQVAITTKDIDPNYAYGGYAVNLLIENKTDKTLRFAENCSAINGVVVDPLFSEEVAPGKKVNTSVVFEINDLLELGIGDPSQIMMNIRAYDVNNLSDDDVLNEVYTIYPLGEENVTTFKREAQESDVVLVENDDFKVSVIGYETDDFWGYMMNLFIENKTDKNLTFSIDDASVNGFMIDPYFSIDVAKGCVCFDAVSYDNDDLKKNGIEQVEEIEFKLRVYDADDWSADNLLEETYKVNP